MALQALLNTPLALRPAAAQALIAAAARTDAGLTLDMQASSACCSRSGGWRVMTASGRTYGGRWLTRKCMRWRSISTRPAGWSRAALIWAMVNEQACSAAYALASSADVVTVPRTGTTGSIGILYLHVDVSRAQRDA